MRSRVAVFAAVALIGLAAPRVEANLLPAPVRKAFAPATRLVRKQSLRLSVKTSTTLNKAEAALRPDHPGLAEAIARTRKAGKPLSPVRLAGFAAQHVKRNPALVPTYLGLALPLDSARLYAASTLPPAMGGLVYAATAVPSALTSVFAAGHATRLLKSEKGARPTLRDTLHGLVGEYRAYNERQDRRLERATRTLGE